MGTTLRSAMAPTMPHIYKVSGDFRGALVCLSAQAERSRKPGLRSPSDTSLTLGRQPAHWVLKINTLRVGLQQIKQPGGAKTGGGSCGAEDRDAKPVLRCQQQVQRADASEHQQHPRRKRETPKTGRHDEARRRKHESAQAVAAVEADPAL